MVIGFAREVQRRRRPRVAVTREGVSFRFTYDGLPLFGDGRSKMPWTRTAERSEIFDNIWESVEYRRAALANGGSDTVF